MALLLGAEKGLGQALVKEQVKAPGGGWGWAGQQEVGLESKEGRPGGPVAWGKEQEHRPGWDGEVEGAQGWGKAEPLSGVPEALERGLGRAGGARRVVVAPGHQTGGQKGRRVVEAGVLGPGMGRGVHAGAEGAAGPAEGQMPLEKQEAAAQSWGLEILRGSQRRRGAGLGVMSGVAGPPQGKYRAGALGSRAGEEEQE